MVMDLLSNNKNNLTFKIYFQSRNHVKTYATPDSKMANSRKIALYFPLCTPICTIDSCKELRPVSVHIDTHRHDVYRCSFYKRNFINFLKTSVSRIFRQNNKGQLILFTSSSKKHWRFSKGTCRKFSMLLIEVPTRVSPKTWPGDTCAKCAPISAKSIGSCIITEAPTKGRVLALYMSRSTFNAIASPTSRPLPCAFW